MLSCASGALRAPRATAVLRVPSRLASSAAAPLAFALGTPPPPPAGDVRVRDSTDADVPAIAAIYADAVLRGTGTFELAPPSLEEMARRRAAVLAGGHPHVVAVAGAAVVGFAYAAQFRPREAYRFTLEDSVYIAPGWQGRGVGGALLREVVARAEGAGARSLVAVIGDSANAGSIGLHRACGFAPAGVLPAVGWKFGRWLDVVMMTRALGAGKASAPGE